MASNGSRTIFRASGTFGRAEHCEDVKEDLPIEHDPAANGGQDRPVAPALDCVGLGCGRRFPYLVIAGRRHPAFATLRCRSRDALDRVVGDGVAFAEEVGQRRERRRLVPDCAAGEVVARGDDVGTGYGAELDEPSGAREAYEIAYGGLVGAVGRGVRQVGELPHLRQHLGRGWSAAAIRGRLRGVVWQSHAIRTILNLISRACIGR